MLADQIPVGTRVHSVRNPKCPETLFVGTVVGYAFIQEGKSSGDKLIVQLDRRAYLRSFGIHTFVSVLVIDPSQAEAE